MKPGNWQVSCLLMARTSPGAVGVSARVVEYERQWRRMQRGDFLQMAITQITMPQLGESVAEGTVGSWLKQEGEAIRRDESLVEIVTDKITTELPSPVGGRLVRILVSPDQTVKVGTPIAEIETEAVASAKEAGTSAMPSPAPVSAQNPPHETVRGGATDRISPLARKLAAEHQVDLNQVTGTGEQGRVRKEDILAFVERRNAAPAAAPSAPPRSAPQPAPQLASTEDEYLPVSQMRRRIAEHMVRSKAIAPHATTTIEVDMTRIARWLEANKATFKSQHGFGITFVPFVTKATIAALREVPTMNASWTEDNRIVLRKHIHMGFAVSTDQGLLVPVLRDADQYSIAQLAEQVNDLASRARANRLLPDDISGSTFVVNNPGVFGTIISVPIINQPNAGILSMDAVVKRPVVVEDDAIAVRSMMFLCLSFDHRINDGLQAARFLQSIRRNLDLLSGNIDIHRR